LAGIAFGRAGKLYKTAGPKGLRARSQVVVQFGLRVTPVKREIPSTALRAGSLRLKNGYAQDDRAV